MKLAKKPLDPRLKHYFVRVEVVCCDEGECEAFDKRVAAISSSQAIRKAGMTIVQELSRNANHEGQRQ
jgi:hypothetical protein